MGIILRNTVVFLLIVLLIVILEAQNTRAALITPGNIIKNNNYAALVIDGNNQKILYSKNANTKRYPASLTKIMTLYLVFDQLEQKKLNLSQCLKISTKAARQPKMRLGLRRGGTITVEQAIYALIIKSANDVAVVLAENIAGSESNFAKIMTQKARQLGMKNTAFRNASGLHNPHQFTTCHDMLKLAVSLQRNHPKYFRLFAKKYFKYKNRVIYGHNYVMYRYQGANGIKTGFINASGYNIVTSTNKKAGKLIAVVMGGKTARQRDDHMINLLNYGYTLLEKSQSKKRAVKNVIKKIGKNIFSVLDKKPNKPKNSIFSIIDKNKY